MKKSALISLTLSVLAFSNVGLADQPGIKKELLEDIKAETKKCALQVVENRDGNQTVLQYKSDCNSLKIISQSEAQIYIENNWYSAKIVESPESDGGDLDDLFITNSGGQVIAQRTNIAAFDNVIVAMAGTVSLRQK